MSHGVRLPSLLFLCLGNICRSPLAEGAFRAEAARLGRDLLIDSAGTGDWHVGNPPDTRAQAIARAHGVDISGYRARQVCAGDFRRFTHIFAMDTDNLASLHALAPPDGTAQVGLLLDLVEGRRGRSVADPYLGDARAFARTWDEVSQAARALGTLLGG